MQEPQNTNQLDCLTDWSKLVSEFRLFINEQSAYIECDLKLIAEENPKLAKLNPYAQEALILSQIFLENLEKEFFSYYLGVKESLLVNLAIISKNKSLQPLTAELRCKLLKSEINTKIILILAKNLNRTEGLSLEFINSQINKLLHQQGCDSN